MPCNRDRIPYGIVPLLLAALTGAAAAPVPAPTPVLVRNGDFAVADAAGGPQGWQLAVFHDRPRPDVSVVIEDGRPVCQLTFAVSNPVYCLSLWQAAPPLDTDGEYVARFSCQATGTGTGDMSVALSGGPGCALPCARGWHRPPRNGRWHDVEVRLSGRGLQRDGTVLELCFNNGYEAGDRIRLADLRLAFEPAPPLAVMCTDPPSGVVFTDLRSRTLTGAVRVTKPYEGWPVRVSLYEGEATDKALAVRDLTAAYPRTSWQFDLAPRPTGRYLVTATLLNRDGATTGEATVTAWFLDPSPTTARVVDGRVLLGPDPVVLLGTYHVADWAMDAVNAESRRIGAPLLTRPTMLDGVAKQGFGTFLYTNGIPPEDFLADCDRRGLRPLAAMAGVGREWGGAPIIEQVPRVADDPRILGWGGCDEPGIQNMPKAVQVYRDLKSVSPRKLVVTSFNHPSPLLALEGETPPADLILMDIYTISRPDADLSRVGEAVRQAVGYARAHPGLAVGVAPQAFIYVGGPEPTPQQLRAQLYLGLVNGARAFFPYAYHEDWGKPFADVPGQPDGMSMNPKRQRWWLPDSRMWLAIPGLFAEIRALKPAVLADEAEQPVVATHPTPVQLSTRTAAGNSYLIAVNPLAAPTTVTLRFPAAPVALSPLFGTPRAEADGVEVVLSFGPYGVNVFRFAPQARDP